MRGDGCLDERLDEWPAGESLDFDQRALGIERDIELLFAPCGPLGLQLRPFEITDRAGAIGALDERRN